MFMMHRRFFANAVYVLLLLSSWLCAYLAYSHARNAYRAVGINDGMISARLDIIVKSRTLVGAVDCDSMGLNKFEFISVKEQTLYISINHDKSIFFCK